ncbi:hypothetical protein ACFQ9V_19340 [Leifsonia sp. NPDC056665]|uniref:hypothetical protein n=1 Tax=Leifsonia sp. NPDC056665 TaxID=3345901 RepID=UPI0036851A73
MNESENEMPTNADQPTDDVNTQTPALTPEAAASGTDEAETMVIPTTSDTAETADTLVIPAAEPQASSATSDTATMPTTTPAAPPAAPAEPWLSDTAYAFPVRPVPSGPPPVRWGGIVWGILIILLAATVLVVVSSPVRLAGVTVWLATLSPGGAVAVWIAALGIVIVVSALLGAISAAQRNRRRRRV